MSHLVIARKYRPSKFNEVIGQEQVTVTLKNSIAVEKIAHAYLFSGPRGVGKTTTARILAKAVNCKEYPSEEPCGRCPACTGISGGGFIDVIEIDAASNRGIDDIRQLRENVAFAPAQGRFKVYIIDEAHQITSDAFNALLKTLEEPPPYIIFILATTMPDKLPVTILSRCQHFRFRLIDDDSIKNTLKEICKAEKTKITDDALELLCNDAAGSVRDAESILEQVISSTPGGKITGEGIEFVLGLVESEKIDEVITAVLKKDFKKVFDIVDDIYRGGFSVQQFAKQIIAKLRKVLAVKIGGGSPQGFEGKTADGIFWMLDVLCRAEQEMKWSEFPKILLELCLYKISSDFISIDEAISEISADPVTPVLSRGVKETETESRTERPEPETGPEARKVMDVSEIVGLIKKENKSLGELFDVSQEITLEGNKLSCRFGKDKEIQAKRLIVNSGEIEEYLAKNGVRLTLDIIIVMPENGPEKKPEPKKNTSAEQLEIEEPIIAKLRNIVGGGLEGSADE